MQTLSSTIWEYLNNIVELIRTRDTRIDPLVVYWVVHRPSGGSGITLVLVALTCVIALIVLLFINLVLNSIDVIP